MRIKFFRIHGNRHAGFKSQGPDAKLQDITSALKTNDYDTALQKIRQLDDSARREAVGSEAFIEELRDMGLPPEQKVAIMAALLQGSLKWKNSVLPNNPNDFYTAFMSKETRDVDWFDLECNCWESIIFAAHQVKLVDREGVKSNCLNKNKAEILEWLLRGQRREQRTGDHEDVSTINAPAAGRLVSISVVPRTESSEQAPTPVTDDRSLREEAARQHAITVLQSMSDRLDEMIREMKDDAFSDDADEALSDLARDCGVDDTFCRDHGLSEALDRALVKEMMALVAAYERDGVNPIHNAVEKKLLADKRVEALLAPPQPTPESPHEESPSSSEEEELPEQPMYDYHVALALGGDRYASLDGDRMRIRTMKELLELAHLDDSITITHYLREYVIRDYAPPWTE